MSSLRIGVSMWARSLVRETRRVFVSEGNVDPLSFSLVLYKLKRNEKTRKTEWGDKGNHGRTNQLRNSHERPMGGISNQNKK